jgi:hypothetical protein
VSLVGTGAVVLGQIAIGATGAAGGYVLRAMLTVGVLALAGLSSGRGEQAQSERLGEDLRHPANELASEKGFA